jgi:1,2-phenylacetyl-CoA epoxidase catalytic subunit
MYTEAQTPRLSAAQLNHLHDQARRDARMLRDAAIDELWTRAKAMLQAGLSGARRAAARRTQRHQRSAGVCA